MLLNTVSKNTLIKSTKNQSPVIAVIYLLLNISFQDQKLSSMSQNYDHVDYSLFSHKGSKNDNKNMRHVKKQFMTQEGYMIHPNYLQLITFFVSMWLRILVKHYTSIIQFCSHYHIQYLEVLNKFEICKLVIYCLL